MPVKLSIAGLATWLWITTLTVTVGCGAASLGAPGWYAHLHKPSYTPAGWAFGPVWGLLYLAMAVAAWLVWRETGFCLAEKPACARTWQALGLYLGQLVLNAVWLGIFFGHHDLGGAMLVICILLAFILATLVMFWRQTRLAGWLFLPYMIWVAFAAVINGALWMMNK